MKYTKEFNIYSFPFWAGAVYVVRHYAKKHMLDDLEQIVIDRFCDETPTETDVNDFVWFEIPEIME